MAVDIAEVYKDLHANPELSFEEHRTADIAARHLEALGFTVTTGLGVTGVVGVLANGDGPTVLLRADMDGLPVEEETGLPYASTRTATGPDGVEVPVMHACGHDVHVACLMGATERLSDTRDEWSGTLVAVFQPAEELGRGAKAMVDDGLLDLIPRPDVVLGQHVAPGPAGFIGVRPGVTMAASDSIDIRFFGAGGHGSRPETTVDPVVLAAAATLRLQGIVSREIAATESAVITVGQIHAGTKNNIIPAEATIGLSVRTFNETTRDKVVHAIERIVRAEAAASNAPGEPEITYNESLPPTNNDPAATERLTATFRQKFGDDRVWDPGSVTGSEDVSWFATSSEAPLVFWFLGGADPVLFKDVRTTGEMPDNIASNHSPFYAPVIEPTLEVGVEALVTAAREWLN